MERREGCFSLLSRKRAPGTFSNPFAAARAPGRGVDGCGSQGASGTSTGIPLRRSFPPLAPPWKIPRGAAPLLREDDRATSGSSKLLSGSSFCLFRAMALCSTDRTVLAPFGRAAEAASCLASPPPPPPLFVPALGAVGACREAAALFCFFTGGGGARWGFTSTCAPPRTWWCAGGLPCWVGTGRVLWVAARAPFTFRSLACKGST